MPGGATAEITTVVVGFLRIYIIIGFIIVVLLLIWIARKMEQLEDEIYKNRSFFENHALGDHHCSDAFARERNDSPASERETITGEPGRLGNRSGGGPAVGRGSPSPASRREED